MKPPWGRLINAALDEGLEPIDALCAVLSAAKTLKTMERPLRAPNTLTARELEVLQSVAIDLDQARAAGDLGLAESTVREYTKRARARLGVHTTEAAIAKAVDLGLIDELERAA